MNDKRSKSFRQTTLCTTRKNSRVIGKKRDHHSADSHKNHEAERIVYLAIVGGRDFRNQTLFDQSIKSLLETYPLDTIDAVVTGGAKGADEMGKCWAVDNNIPVILFLPNWRKYGKAAGILRNGKIVDKATIMLAFWDGKSPGTKNSIQRARAKNIPLVEIRYTKSQ